MKRFGLGGLTAVAMLLSACGDSGPQGPGDLRGTVEPGETPVGAVVIQIQGASLGAIKGTGSTRAFAEAAVSASKRAVLVTDAAGALSFTVAVDDRGGPLPAVTVVEAIGLDNRPITDVRDIDVRIENR